MNEQSLKEKIKFIAKEKGLLFSGHLRVSILLQVKSH